MQDLQLTRMRLHERSEAFNPVPVIAIQDAIEIVNGRAMDVSADDTIEATPTRFPRQGLLKI